MTDNRPEHALQRNGCARKGCTRQAATGRPWGRYCSSRCRMLEWARLHPRQSLLPGVETSDGRATRGEHAGGDGWTAELGAILAAYAPGHRFTADAARQRMTVDPPTQWGRTFGRIAAAHDCHPAGFVRSGRISRKGAWVIEWRKGLRG